MCETCYEQLGSPAVVTAATREAAGLVAAVFEFSDVGGNLHIQIDDWNIDDQHFDGPMRVHDEYASDAQLAAERACYDAMAEMTVAERASALALYEGYITAPA